MAAVVTTVAVVLTLSVYFTNGQNLNTTVVFSPSELIRDSHLVNNSLKLALRYGFQQTAACKDFAKAFICVQKCLDLGFDLANSNKHCFCTCFHKSGKVKSTPQSLATKTKWRLGAPTTKLPVWASTHEEDRNDTEDIHYVLIDGNGSDIITANPTAETETHTTGDGNSTHVTGHVTDHADDNSTSATGVTHDGSANTGGTDSTKDAVTGTGTGGGGAHPSNETGGTNASGATGGTENAHTGTKLNDGTSGGTGIPKADTGGPTTVA